MHRGIQMVEPGNIVEAISVTKSIKEYDAASLVEAIKLSSGPATRIPGPNSDLYKIKPYYLPSDID